MTDDDKHLELVFAEVRELNRRHSWMSFAAWLATIGAFLYGVGQESGNDAISVVGAYTMVVAAVSNIISFIVMKVRTVVADVAHRRWHDENPTAEETEYGDV